MNEVRPPRRRRWLRLALAALALIACVILAAPYVAAPYVRRWTVDRLEEVLAAEVRLGELELSLTGSARADDLRVSDLSGRPVLDVRAIDGSVALPDALFGRYRAEVHVDGFELYAQRESDGRWNLSGLPRDERARDTAKDEPERDDEPPDVKLHATLRNGRVHVRSEHGTSELRDVALDLRVDGLERPATYRLEARVHGPGGPGGRVTAAGEAELGRAPGGSLTLSIEDVLLDRLAPLLPLPVDSCEGRVAGEASFSLAAGGSIEGEGAYRLEGLRLTRSGVAPLSVNRIDVRARSVGSRIDASVKADDFFSGVLFAERGVGTGVWSGELGVDGDVTSLAGLAGFAGLLTLKEGVELGGALIGRTAFELTTDAGLPGAGSLRADWKVADFKALGPAGEPIELGELQQISLHLAASMERATGAWSVETFDARAGPVRAQGTAGVAAIEAASGSGEAPLEGPGGVAAVGATSTGAGGHGVGAHIELTADLDRLAESLRAVADLGDLALSGTIDATADVRGTAGEVEADVRLASQDLVIDELRVSSSPVAGTVRVRPGDGRFDASCELACESLEVRRGEDPPLVQQNVRLSLALERVADDLRFEGLELASNTGTVTARGRVTTLGSDAPGVEVDVAVRAAVERFVTDVGPALGMIGWTGSGSLEADAKVSGSGATTAILASATLEELSLLIPAGEEGGEPFALEDPRAQLTIQAVPEPDTSAVRLERFDVESTFLKGSARGRLSTDAAAEQPKVRFDGVEGEFTYVPDRLGALLSPWLPGRMTGATEEKLVFRLDGEPESLDLAGLLAGSNGTATFGLGQFETSGLAATGDVHVELADGLATVTGDLGANGGLFNVAGLLDLRKAADSRTHLDFKLDGVALNAKLQPLLARVHPAFAVVESLDGSDVQGLISSTIRVEYKGPLDVAGLADGSAPLALDALNLSGTLGIAGATFSGSSLFDRMLAELGVESGDSVELEPIRFLVDRGRLTYDKPWTWTLARTVTTFTGSIGLDETLDLMWHVPITTRLAERYDFLESFEGDVLEVPLGGTVGRPRLEWADALSNLAKTSLRAQLEGELGLGRDDTKGGDSAAGLYEQANQLWSAGDRAEAAKLYKKIRSEFKLSPVYLLNRDRIKKRSKGE